MNTTQGIHTSEIWVHTSDKLLRSLSPMPQLLLRPQCGTLEVFIIRGHDNSILKCLDCKNEGLN